MKTLRRLMGLILVITCGVLVATAKVPPWWITRGVINTNLPPNNYSPVNLGQLKYVAKQAYLEMEAKLPNGAGDTLGDLVFGFAQKTNANYLPINLGQLKYVAKPFYDRLIDEGYVANYPWTQTQADDNNYAAANLGQLKYVFGFDLSNFNPQPGDGDGDGLNDAWEMDNFGNLDPLPDEDPDEDGVSNQEEQEDGTDPNDANDVIIPMPCALIDLSEANDLSEATGLAISEEGVVVGESAQGAFRWEKGQLSLLSATTAYDVNEAGAAVGGSGESEPYAQYWSAGSEEGQGFKSYFDAKLNAEVGTPMHAMGINDNGLMIGYVESQGYRGCYWSSLNSYAVFLKAPDYDPEWPINYTLAIPTAVNNSGKVVGHWWNQDEEKTYAVKWNSLGAVAQIIGEGSATDINDEGQIVGWRDSGNNNMMLKTDSKNFTSLSMKMKKTASKLYGPNQFKAKEQSKEQKMSQPTAMLYPNTSLGSGMAFGINDEGVIVGQSQGQAVMWIKNPTNNVYQKYKYKLDEQSGWQPAQAIAINNAGVVTGQGVKEGQLKAIAMLPLQITNLWSDQLPEVHANWIQKAKTANEMYMTGQDSKPYILMGARADGKAYVKAALKDKLPENFEDALLFRLSVKGENDPKPGTSTYDSDKQELTITVEDLGSEEKDYVVVVGYDANKNKQLEANEVSYKNDWVCKIVPQEQYDNDIGFLNGCKNTLLFDAPLAGDCLTAFIEETTPNGATSVDTEIARNEYGLSHAVGILFQPVAEPGPSIKAIFDENSLMVEKIMDSSALKNWLNEQFELKKSYVQQTLNNVTNEVVQFNWQLPALDVEFGEILDFDLATSLGHVNSAKNPMQVKVNVNVASGKTIEVKMAGTLVDLYDFNYDGKFFVFVKPAARIQSGYNTLGKAGRVYKSEIQLIDSLWPGEFDFNNL